MSIRKYALLLGFILSALCFKPVQAQTFAEWWNQKKTQKKYLVQQIAALQVYMGYLQNGYNIVHSGLTSIKDITNGEFHLHDAYISSLKRVNPVIRDDRRIDEIIAMREYISEAFNHVVVSSLLPTVYLDYLRSVQAVVNAECDRDMDELLLVITSGKLEMKDDERIERLNKVYLAMQDKTAFTQHFCNEAALFIRKRSGEERSIDQLRRYYDRD